MSSEGSNFIDYVKIYCAAGNGGAGSTHFMRSKEDSKGGPDGGDGGRGGHIILRGNKQMYTLLPLKFRKHIKAGQGENGGSNRKHGADGWDEVIDVPLGTIAKDEETGQVIFEVQEDGEMQILRYGGLGGRGNDHFKSPTNRAPRYSQPGTSGEKGWNILELKVLADVGLVGFPNAGKSTLLSVVSAAKPKIANYEFTTLTPNLGVIKYREGLHSFVMADIPGIIEGASEGRGLGYRFLRHIERNAVLLFMIPADSKDIQKEFEVLKNELFKYKKELLQKHALLAITKSDMLDEELMEEMKEEIPDGIETLFISSVVQQGLSELKDKLWQKIQDAKKEFD
ncbi:MAG: GTPase ObgE [Flavobacteriales bacterium]|jgi:GTP-binding protein|nr:GTPase ObgE [Flavobacteriales bacterium]